jgi:hypothetical protein
MRPGRNLITLDGLFDHAAFFAGKTSGLATMLLLPANFRFQSE